MDAAGVIPLDARFNALITDPRVTMMLLPLPGGSRKDDPPKKNDLKVDDVDPPNKGQEGEENPGRASMSRGTQEV